MSKSKKRSRTLDLTIGSKLFLAGIKGRIHKDDTLVDKQIFGSLDEAKKFVENAWGSSAKAASPGGVAVDMSRYLGYVEHYNSKGKLLWTREFKMPEKPIAVWSD